MWRTMLVTVSTCFLLGTTFTHWIADHNVLWRSPITTDALVSSITYYSFLSDAPKGMVWVYVGVGIIALLSAGGRAVKGYKGQGGEVLFDGGSIVLWSAIAYTQITEVYPTIRIFPSPLSTPLVDSPRYPESANAVRDLASNNIMTAVMLTGIMLLQAGRYYSKRPSSSSSLPPSTLTSATSTPARTASPASEIQAGASAGPAPRRSGTPYRELSEAEALDLRGK
ncbi:hypothetical protein I317_03621 [Kwoniella heveanensis CBS 569]|nr:hypothetical protein I317_03621 [Kwoniella heveanensis CBS 569]